MLILLLLFLCTASARMDPKVVGGSAAKINDWPYIAFLFISKESSDNNDNNGGACGGSLISSQTILTAAHCVIEKSTTEKKSLSNVSMAMMGSSDFRQATMVRMIIDYKAHYGYSPQDNLCDIALVFLRKPVRFSDTVKKILLMKEIDYETDKLMVVAGWGAVSVTDPVVKPDLKSLPQILLSEDKCKKYFFKPGTICAGNFNAPEFPFSGDSGGPIVRAGSHSQMGIVSFRATLFIKHRIVTTTVYTSVPHYYEWIADTQYSLFQAHCSEAVAKPK